MHPTIKLRIDPEESAPIAQPAKELHLTPDAIAYAGLNCIMRRVRVTGGPKAIVDLRLGRHEGLPTWADDARGVHIYGRKQDEQRRAPDARQLRMYCARFRRALLSSVTTSPRPSPSFRTAAPPFSAISRKPPEPASATSCPGCTA